MEKEKATVSSKEIQEEYERQLKQGILPAGLYSIYALGVAKDKKNPKALVIEDANIQTRVMGIFGYKTSSLAKAIISWDNMAKGELCPEIGLSPTMIIEPIQIFNAGPDRNCIYTRES